MLKGIPRGIAVAFIAVLVLVTATYQWEMHHAYNRVKARGTVFASPYGDIEYAHGGLGPPVLVIHGSGGGYDQGELMVQAVLGDHFHWIAPSLWVSALHLSRWCHL